MTSPPNPARVTIGHWTDMEKRTGCTVILFDQLVPTVVDIRGGAPGTRETDLLGPSQTVGKVDAILLTGGSAHGLAAADGVMQFLRECERGVDTRAGRVPIVTAAVIYDLAVGEPAWPTSENGYAACLSAELPKTSQIGMLGVGAGATYRKAWPALEPLSAGFGIATVDIPVLGSVQAFVVVNAIGDLASSVTAVDPRWSLLEQPAAVEDRTATSLIVVVLDGEADARTLRRCAVAAHDGLARTIVPSHTQWDGDLAYVACTGQVSDISADDSFRWAIAAELAVEAAIRTAIDSTHR